MFEIVLIPAFKDNYIWLLVRDGRAAVVDPGDAIIVDGASGEVHVRPTNDVQHAYADKARLRQGRVKWDGGKESGKPEKAPRN